MKEWIAFLLPPATAFAGMRLNRLILGQKLNENFGFGVRFALGLAIGMVVFSQSILLTTLIGINASFLLAWGALLWGATEAAILSPQVVAGVKQFKFQRGHLWLLLLLPVLYSWWVFGRLATVEGTLEFDANAFWVFKAKMMYLDQGKNFLNVIHTTNLGYAHLDYPLLVPSLYTLTYGAVGQVWEFTNKVWPFWMVVSLCIAILSLARVWNRPKPLAVFLILLFCFLPATLQFIRQEGGTIPMVYCTGMTAILMVTAIAYADEIALCAGILLLTECANTKFEGVIFTALWGTVALIFAWRNGWIKSRLLWKTILIAAVCMFPYFCYRMAKPILHPESGWMHDATKSPSTVMHRFPQTLTLNIGNRFFTKDFFHWSTTDKDHIQYDGHWTGLGNLVNPDLSVMPWLMLFMIGLSFWKKPRHRLALGVLLAVMFVQLAILSFVISCLGVMQADVAQVITFASDVVGRYYYPFFTACFLGVMAIWFVDRDPVLKPVAAAIPLAAPVKQKNRPKGRR